MNRDLILRLLSHVNDATIDVKVARDYILYLCPVGQLQQEFFDFWQKSYQECGWNRAHNYFPHITLCSFFQVHELAHLFNYLYFCYLYNFFLSFFFLLYFIDNLHC